MKNKALRFIIAVIAVMMSALPAKADERVDILIVDPTSGVIHRSPAPITCWLEGEELCATFFENLGLVTVEIENLTTSEYTLTEVNSATGSAVFPISGNAGFWTITFSLSDGTMYYGEFEI